MDKRFDIDILGEVIDFLNALETKPRKKIYYNLRKAQSINDTGLFKKLLSLYGSFEHFMIKSTIDYWHFGIKQIKWILLFWQHMVLLKRLR